MPVSAIPPTTAPGSALVMVVAPEPLLMNVDKLIVMGAPGVVPPNDRAGRRKHRAWFTAVTVSAAVSVSVL